MQVHKGLVGLLAINKKLGRGGQRGWGGTQFESQHGFTELEGGEFIGVHNLWTWQPWNARTQHDVVNAIGGAGSIY